MPQSPLASYKQSYRESDLQAIVCFGQTNDGSPLYLCRAYVGAEVAPAKYNLDEDILMEQNFKSSNAFKFLQFLKIKWQDNQFTAQFHQTLKTGTT